MPPLTLPTPTPHLITATPLTPIAFSPFGTCITNPSTPHLAHSANQGTALKYAHISPLLDFYAQAPSQRPSAAQLNMFVCSPRVLQPSGAGTGTGGEFEVGILERHPFTTQTFTPLGLSPSSSTRFLIIVAPSLPLSEADIGLPVPRSAGNTGVMLPGRGLPDLSNVKAFLAGGGMAVTYAAGTWHAPMVVLGESEISFVVAQFGNGVAEEDCQEVFWGGGGVRVRVEMEAAVEGEGRREEVVRVERGGEKGEGMATESVLTDRLGEEGKKAIHGLQNGEPKL